MKHWVDIAWTCVPDEREKLFQLGERLIAAEGCSNIKRSEWGDSRIMVSGEYHT